MGELNSSLSSFDVINKGRMALSLVVLTPSSSSCNSSDTAEENAAQISPVHTEYEIVCTTTV